jgi:hypothetical protein
LTDPIRSGCWRRVSQGAPRRGDSSAPEGRTDIPTIWITKRDVMYFSGTAVDIHGAPIGDDLREFEGIAIDPDDLLIFESEATYLDRHGLFLPGERKRLTKEDWEPEPIADSTT